MPAAQATPACQVWPEDTAGFSTFKVGRLQHNFHRHPLFQVDALERLALELEPLGQCRFVRPGITPGSSFAHADRHPEGLSIAEVFRRLDEPGSWLALYNVEAVPRYAALLEEVIDTVRAIIEREQSGIFNITGFIFLSAPPSVTPFHIDRENNFWLQLHGRKTINVWSHADRVVVPADAVEDFIVSHSLKRVRFREELRERSNEFETVPGDGVYFPSTSPHMTRSVVEGSGPQDAVSVSIGVNFYTDVTRNTARVHQVNRLLRKVFGVVPAYPGESPAVDALKAPLGKAVGATRQMLGKTRRAVRGWRWGDLASMSWRGGKEPPGSF